MGVPRREFPWCVWLRPGLSAIAGFLGALPLALLAANAIMWKVVPARRALDAESKKFPSTDLQSSQKALTKVASVSVPLALTLLVLGALLPW